MLEKNLSEKNLYSNHIVNHIIVYFAIFLNGKLKIVIGPSESSDFKYMKIFLKVKILTNP